MWEMIGIYRDRLIEIVELSYKIMCNKIVHKGIKVDNEASFQLQLAYILKYVGNLYEFSDNDRFKIELENYLTLSKKSIKSKSYKARVDIILSLGNSKVTHNCAIELKYFKKANHREPNNRYDVFKDLSNLESYRDSGIDLCYFMLGTDHEHYVNQACYSKDTSDFDFRDGSTYCKGEKLSYNTKKPYGPPIVLKQDYKFKWKCANDIYFLIVPVHTI